MNRLQLWKAASDFAYANAGLTSSIDIAQAQVESFKAASFDQMDYQLWSQYTNQLLQQYRSLAKQLTPSAQALASAPKVAPAIPNLA